MQELIYIASGSRDFQAFYTLKPGVTLDKHTWCEIIDIFLDECSIDSNKYLEYAGNEMYSVSDYLGFDREFKLYTIDLDEY